MALRFIPANVNETTEPVDHPGGVLTIFLVGAFIMGINFVVVPGKGSVAIGLFAISAAALIAFFIRERRARNPSMTSMWRPGARSGWPRSRGSSSSAR